MNQQNINALIKRYYEGTTSVEEEDYLKNYLNNNDDDFDEIHSHINVLNEISNSNEELNSDFDVKIIGQLDNPDNNKKSRLNFIRTISGVAATIIVLISIWVATDFISPKAVYGTVNDPVIAFAETKKALQEVSKNVKKAVSPVKINFKKVEDGFDKTSKIKKVNEAIENVKKIKKLSNTGLLLKSMTKVTVKSGKS
jgi:hypothetical protein